MLTDSHWQLMQVYPGSARQSEGGVSECLEETEKIENRFLSSFGLFAWVVFFFGGGALQHQIQSVGGEDADSR